MTDENTPKDEQKADDRKLLDDARRQVEEVRQRAEATATSPQTARIEAPGAGFVVPARLGSVRLVREIGRGGMGVVHLGWDELLERNVAVKFLLNAISGPDDPDFAQFLKGARAAAAVKHPGLTTTYHADLVENVPYLVLEYVDGPTLRQVVKQTGPLSVAATLAVMDAVSTAIGELHNRGIIHRDIKPSNVLLDRDGHVFVTDFGLACARPSGTTGATITGVAGTLAYMAPELFEGVVSTRSDVYALGIMAYELLAAELPFTGNADEIRSKHQQDQLPLEALRERQVAPAVIEVIERATHKDAMFRYKSARHLLEALTHAVPGRACWAEGRKALPQLVSPAAERTEAGSSSSQNYYETLGAQAARKRDARPHVDDRANAKGTGPVPHHAAYPSGQRILAQEGSDSGSSRGVTQLKRCPDCDYGLQGLPSEHRCPECGFEYDEQTYIWRPSVLKNIWLWDTDPLVMVLIVLMITVTAVQWGTLTSYWGIVILVFVAWFVWDWVRKHRKWRRRSLVVSPKGLFVNSERVHELVPWNEWSDNEELIVEAFDIDELMKPSRKGGVFDTPQDEEVFRSAVAEARERYSHAAE